MIPSLPLRGALCAALLLVPGVAPAVDVIKDNTDATGVTFTGSWSTSTATSGYHGANYHGDGNTAKGTKSVLYTPTIPATGRYAVYVKWTSALNRASTVPLQINYAGGSANKVLNQTANGAVWMLQGVYPFNAGTAGSVLLSNNSPGHVIADAVLFSSVPEVIYEAESTTRTGTDSISSLTDARASNGAFERFNANAAADYTEYTIPVAAPGNYVAILRYQSGSSRGQGQPSIAGVNQGGVLDQYSSLSAWTEADLGSVNFATSGNKAFRYTVTGKNSFSSGYDLTFDALKLLPALRSEAESIATATSSKPLNVFSEAAASGGSAEKLDSTVAGDYATYTVNVAEAGTYGIKFRYKGGATRGKFQLAIDGVSQGGEVDQFASTGVWVEVGLGSKTFATAGNKNFTFTVTGKHASSSGFDLTFDYLQLHNTGPDKDADSLPDTWEVLNGLNPASAADATADADSDGISNLAEYLAGSDPFVANGNGGGVIAASVITANAYEKEGTPARVRFTRTGGSSAITINYTRSGGAGASDYAVTDGNGTPLSGSVSLGVGQSSVDLVLNPVHDTIAEYPESATITAAAGAGYNVGSPSAALATINDATNITANETLFIAPVTPVAGASSSASGVGTMYLNGSKTQARINLSFNGLSSTQTNAYIRYGGTGTELRPNLGTGQLSGVIWNIVAAPPYSGQQIIDALFQNSGYAIVNVGTTNYPSGEIQGTWAREHTGGVYPPPDPPAIATLTGTDLRRDVTRFLTQATYGPTKAEIDALVTSVTSTHGGNRIAAYNAWIDAQLALDQTNLEAYTRAVNLREWTSRGQPTNGPSTFTNSVNGGYKWAWWLASIRGHDQLRQRFAFAASQIFVISGENFTLRNQGLGMVNFYDMLGAHATGNFRSLLEGVSKHPAMGQYLSSLRNQKLTVNAQGIPITSPDENYAREIMQLFSIGLVQRRLDGAVQMDGSGDPIETYSNDDIQNLARVFTGWSFGKCLGAAPNYPPIDNNDFMLSAVSSSQGLMGYAWTHPMKNFPAYHDVQGKTVLGQDIPAGLDGEQDLDAAHDILHNYASTAPFISKLLIQRFTTSNPSPGYIYRVAQKFVNNGSGVRGDMKAVLKAILLDYEARTLSIAAEDTSGKQKEPVLRFAQMMRALGGASQISISELSSYGYPASQLDNFPGGATYYMFGGTDQLYQTPQFAPTVFNWYLPDYTPGGDLAALGLVAPEMQITTESQVISSINFHRQMATPSGLILSATLHNQTNGALNDIKIDLTGVNAAYDTAISSGQNITQATTAALDYLDDILMAGNLKARYASAPTPNPRSILIGGVAGMSISTTTERMQELLYLVITTPEFIHQK